MLQIFAAIPLLASFPAPQHLQRRFWTQVDWLDYAITQIGGLWTPFTISFILWITSFTIQLTLEITIGKTGFLYNNNGYKTDSTEAQMSCLSAVSRTGVSHLSPHLGQFSAGENRQPHQHS